MQLSKTEFRLSRLDSGIALCTALAAFAFYTRTLYPGLLPGDSGEFQKLAYLLAHTHPTGYDVYLLLARLFILIPAEHRHSPDLFRYPRRRIGEFWLSPGCGLAGSAKNL